MPIRANVGVLYELADGPAVGLTGYVLKPGDVLLRFRSQGARDAFIVTPNGFPDSRFGDENTAQIYLIASWAGRAVGSCELAIIKDAQKVA